MPSPMRPLAAAITATAVGCAALWAQSPGTAPRVAPRPGNVSPSVHWRQPDIAGSGVQTVHYAQDDGTLRGDVAEPAGPVARPVSSGGVPGIGGLPSEAGQVWREYDISNYTLRVTSTKKPEQAVIDWILRETGYEAWHSEPLGILSAGPRRLRVYHTPAMQAVVAEMVERFIDGDALAHAFQIRVVTLSNPNWRTRAHRVIHPVPVQSPGIQAWVMAREDSALLLAELQKRSDFREHSSPRLLVHNGQSHVVSWTRPRTYIQDLALRPESWPGFEAVAGRVDEGFAIEFSPLLSRDKRSIDCVLKCHIDQLEELRPVVLEIPTALQPRQRTKIEVPQISQCRVQERFRWPVDQVLLVGLGVVPAPSHVDNTSLLPGLTGSGPSRADMLIFIESRGSHTNSQVVGPAQRPTASPMRR